MAGRLKPLGVEREEKHGKYADGDGLQLSQSYQLHRRMPTGTGLF
jgi:hypothetical protein